MTEDYIAGTINITIPSFQDKDIEKKKVTFYQIEIYNNYSRNKWTLEKRYNDFVELHKSLNKLYPNCPTIPGKSFFKISSLSEITKRKDGLEKFLRDCVVRKDIMNSEHFRYFIEIDNNSPELTSFTPKKLTELLDLPLGIRDFVHLKYEKIFFLALSDMNIASRLDAYLTNVNLPWEKKTNAHVTVGALIVYRYKQDGDSFFFEKLWTKSYPIQTGSVFWDSESNHLLVGLDNGIIKCYKVSPDLNFLQYEEICEIKAHTDRVMGMSYDNKTGCIYSAGTDKKFKITEIHYKECVSEITVGSHGCTNLHYDKKNLRVFITNEVGVIYIYSIINNSPNLIFSIQSTSKSSIRGLHIDFLKYYIFTASVDGKICIFDLNQPGKERFIKEIGILETKKKMRVIRYNFANHEIITGDQDGKISVWSLKGGEPLRILYLKVDVFEAHKGAITQLLWDEDNKLLISVGKDKALRYWKFPAKWRNEEIEKFEENEIKIQKDTIGMLKIQKTLTKDIEYDDSDDDLNGWDFKN